MRRVALAASVLIAVLLQSVSEVNGRSLRLSSPNVEDRLDVVATIRPRDDEDDSDSSLNVCSPPEYGSSINDRRDLHGHSLDHERCSTTQGVAVNETMSSSDLMRRVMTLPDDDTKGAMDRFILAEVAKAPPIVWENHLGNDQNTAKADVFGATAISVGMRYLTGCTGLVVVSRQGWYATHYWESISFVPSKNDLKMWKFKDEEDALQRSVLTPLEKGKGQGQASLKKNAGLFADDSVRAYLVIPAQQLKGDVGKSREKWDRIKATVGSLIPGLEQEAHGDRWKEVSYRRYGVDTIALDRSAAGSVLIKFDPDHPEDSKRKKVTMWVAGEQVHNDEWD